MILRAFASLKNCLIQNSWRINGYRNHHSIKQLLNMSDMNVHILPALSDNYMYLIVCNKTKEAAIVDPVNPEFVIETVKKEGVNLKSVLTTHHHWDHAGGNEKLISLFKNPLIIYGGDDRIGGINKKVKHDDVFQIGNLNVRCLFTPCHTSGHICYYIESGDERAVFTGDTLFSGGCGRFFEGTAEQMYSALIEKLSNLPDDTKVFCGHEYTLANLKYGIHIEPNNQDIVEKIKWSKAKRDANEPTIPSTIGEEKKINPFMRVHCESVQKFANAVGNPIETMAYIRKIKDSFK